MNLPLELELDRDEAGRVGALARDSKFNPRRLRGLRGELATRARGAEGEAVVKLEAQGLRPWRRDAIRPLHRPRSGIEVNLKDDDLFFPVGVEGLVNGARLRSLLLHYNHKYEKIK